MASTILIIFASIGLLVSIYAFYVEKKLEKNRNYKPLCDIADKVSCSKNFISLDASIFGIKNSILGITFYILIIILAYLNLINYLFYISIPAFILTIYLAYSSFIKLKNFCLVCTLIYIINILITLISYKVL